MELGIIMKLPKCCGHEMSIRMDVGRFLEVQCSGCKDVVYVKKSEIPKPQLIDD